MADLNVRATVDEVMATEPRLVLRALAEVLLAEVNRLRARSDILLVEANRVRATAGLGALPEAPLGTVALQQFVAAIKNTL